MISFSFIKTVLYENKTKTFVTISIHAVTQSNILNKTENGKAW